MTDLALIVIAAVATTVAVCLVAFHVYSGSRRRQLARVREQRNRWYAEARTLRADRPAVHRTLAEHAAQADPISYTLVDRSAYLPAFEGDRVADYVQLRDATRKVWQVTR